MQPIVCGLVLVPACALALLAQSTFVVPVSAASQDGNSSGHLAGAVTRIRQQIVVGPSHLRPLIGQRITEIALRRDGFVEPHGLGSATLTVTMSAATAMTVNDVRPRFAENHKSNPVTVFQGTIALPASPRLPDRNATTWGLNHVISVPLTTPFLYQGGVLVVQFDGAPVGGATTTRWSADFVDDGVRGRVTELGPACGHATTKIARTASTDAQALRAGSTARFVHLARANSFDVFMLGVNALPPISLAAFGAPGCYLHMDPVILLPVMVPSAVGARTIAGANVFLDMPSETAALGAVFHVQWLNIEGLSRLSTSNGLRIELATAPAWLDAGVVTSTSTPSGALPETGVVELWRMPVLRLTHLPPP
jgi:hypothetical protein